MKNKCFSLIMTLIMAIAMMPTITFTSYATENTMSFTEFQQLLSAKKTTTITRIICIIITPIAREITQLSLANSNANWNTFISEKISIDVE